MTALPGAGALPGTVGALGVGAAPPPEELPDDDEEEELFVSLSCCAKGSLLANLLNDANWPSCRAGAGAEASEPDESVVAPPGGSAPLSDGAASVGVLAGVGVVGVLAEGRTGGAGCILFITFCASNATRSRKTTPRTASTIFCFFSLALSGSTCFFAIRELLSPTHRSGLPRSWSRWSWSSRSSSASQGSQ